MRRYILILFGLILIYNCRGQYSNLYKNHKNEYHNSEYHTTYTRLTNYLLTTKTENMNDFIKNVLIDYGLSGINRGYYSAYLKYEMLHLSNWYDAVVAETKHIDGDNIHIDIISMYRKIPCPAVLVFTNDILCSAGAGWWLKESGYDVIKVYDTNTCNIIIFYYINYPKYKFYAIINGNLINILNCPFDGGSRTLDNLLCDTDFTSEIVKICADEIKLVYKIRFYDPETRALLFSEKIFVKYLWDIKYNRYKNYDGVEEKYIKLVSGDRDEIFNQFISKINYLKKYGNKQQKEWINRKRQ